MFNWVLRPGAFLEKCQRDYGDLFVLHLDVAGGTPSVLIADPQVAMKLFRDPSLTRVGATRTPMAPVFGDNSILLLDGAEHMRQRQSLRPAFHGTRLDRYRDGIVAATDREVDHWPVGQAFALRPRLQAITLDSILDSVFGFHDLSRRADIGCRIYRLLAVAGSNAAFLGRALPGRLRALAAQSISKRRRALDEAILEEISRRRADPSLPDRMDALSHLLVANGDRPVSDEMLCDQVRTLLLAGHESTATSLAWSVEHLVHEPKAFDRLTSEVKAGQEGDRYIDAVASESLRLSPPLLSVQRQLIEPLDAGGYLLPPSTLVAPCPYLIHRRADLYEDPHAFRPERFLNRSPDPAAWLSFGGGSRRCLGAQFARFQMNTVLRRLFERTHLSAASPQRRGPAHLRGIVFSPFRGARVIMNERRAV